MNLAKLAIHKDKKSANTTSLKGKIDRKEVK
jgi:hypothetical protein